MSKQDPPHRQSLPYVIHTNRELGFMLSGVKPLSRFTDRVENFPDAVLRYLRLFDRLVTSGRFVRHDELVEAKHTDAQLHYIYFALAGEEWRIQAMIDLVAQTGRWTLQNERKEGELFGYTPEQNDIWIDLQRSKFKKNIVHFS